MVTDKTLNVPELKVLILCNNTKTFLVLLSGLTLGQGTMTTQLLPWQCRQQGAIATRDLHIPWINN